MTIVFLHLNFTTMAVQTTARRNKRVDKTIRSIRQKVANNPLRLKAHQKVNNMTKVELLKFLGEKITQKISKFISSLFLKTISLNIVGRKESFTVSENSVKDLLKKVFERELKIKKPTPYVDNNIWSWFLGKIIPGFKNFSSTIYRFLQNLTHRQILAEAEKTGVKKIYSYFEALSVICEVVLNGEVDEKGKGIMVYFQVEGINKQYRFRAYRDDGGQLDLYVCEVILDNEWPARGGACFS